MNATAPSKTKRRVGVIILAVCAAALVGMVVFSSHRTQRGPLWTHEYLGEGHIHSVATGALPDAREAVFAAGYAVTDDSGHDLRLIAYQANTGAILWEKREPRGMKPYMNAEPRLAFDFSGLFCGFEYSAVRSGAQRSIAKLSLTDGAEIWSWFSDAPGSGNGAAGHGHLTQPAGFARGQVWVSGIRCVPQTGYQRFAALLDSKSGEQRWLTALNEADSVHDRPTEIWPLAEADAILMSPPRHHERSFPWVLQRLKESNGEIVWERTFLRDNERNLSLPLHLIDETQGQVLVFWHQVVNGSWEAEIISLDLVTGTERWRRKSDYWERLPYPVAASLSSNNNACLIGAKEWTTTRTHWLDWRKDSDLPFPLPTSTSKRHVRPLMVELCGADGSHISTT